MTPRDFILRASIPMMAAMLAASPASAMRTRDVGAQAAGHEVRTRQAVLLPGRVDAAAHAATIRGLGARLAERAG